MIKITPSIFLTWIDPHSKSRLRTWAMHLVEDTILLLWVSISGKIPALHSFWYMALLEVYKYCTVARLFTFLQDLIFGMCFGKLVISLSPCTPVTISTIHSNCVGGFPICLMISKQCYRMLSDAINLWSGVYVYASTAMMLIKRNIKVRVCTSTSLVISTSKENATIYMYSPIRRSVVLTFISSNCFLCQT